MSGPSFLEPLGHVLVWDLQGKSPQALVCSTECNSLCFLATHSVAQAVLLLTNPLLSLLCLIAL